MLLSVVATFRHPVHLMHAQIRTALQAEFGECVQTIYKDRVIAAIKEEIQK